jgi:hypothetical protein
LNESGVLPPIERSIDPEIVDRDLEELTRITRTIRRYATKQIAHLDAKQLKDLPTYDALDSALDVDSQ